jgi:nucleoside-diphosphate-sugar epimerase
MPKAIVFGANGYVGRHVVRELVMQGYTVTGFVRSASAAGEVRALGADVIVGDLGDRASVAAMVEGQDAVVLAAQLPFEDELDVCRIILATMKGSDRAFIFTSGTSLMSIPTNGLWDERNYAEDEPFTPRRQIAPRLIAEQLVRDAAADGVRGIVIRPPLIWGNGGCQIIEDFYYSAKATGAVCYVGRGLNVYSNVHVEDLALLYRLAIEKGTPGALYFSVAGEVSFGIMAQTIAGQLGVPVRSVTVEEACDIWDPMWGKIVLPSCSRQRSPRARTELGWTPHEDRLDILEECRNPIYRLARDRVTPAWVRKETA